MTRRKKPFRIGEKQKAAAVILAEGSYCSIQEAADLMGVHRSTLWRWWQHPEFQRYCERIRRAAVAAAMKEARKETQAVRRELRKKERAFAKQKAQAQQDEYKHWLIEQSVPEEVVQEAVRLLDSASAKPHNKKRATSEA